MKLLVSTVNCILYVNLKNRIVHVLEDHRPEYYGISWFADSDQLVLSHSGIDNDSLLDLEAYANSEKGCISFGEETTPSLLSQPHQILCASNGWVIATNTGRNCITIYNPVNGFYKELRVNDVRWDRLSKTDYSGDHFNSVYIKNNFLYVLAHGFNKKAYVLKYSYPECKLLEQYPLSNAKGVHNIWVDDSDNILVLNSSQGEIIEVKNNKILWKSNIEAYLRGLAVSEKLIIVGSSRIEARENRKFLPSDLWLIQRENFQTKECLFLGDYGGVHEIRLLDTEDFAHHSHSFKGVDSLEINAKKQKSTRIINNNVWRYLQEETNPLDLKFGEIEVDKHQKWVQAKEFAILLTKNNPKDDFTVSLDYRLDPFEPNLIKHISFILGYKGEGDDEMHAFLLLLTAKHNASLSLWKNTKGDWKQIELLIEQTSSKGLFKLIKKDNSIIINCNHHPQIQLDFKPHDMEGKMGIRTLRGEFKNFVMSA